MSCSHQVYVQEEAKQYRYPTVESFLHWVRARISVSFRRLDQPKVKLIPLCSSLHLAAYVLCLVDSAVP